MLYPPSQRLVSAHPSPRRIAVIAAMGAGLCTMLYPPSKRLVSVRPSPRRIAVIAAMGDQRHRRVARAELGERAHHGGAPPVSDVGKSAPHELLRL